MTTAEILAKATNRPWDEYTLCALRSVEEDEANEQLCVLAVNSYEANEALIEKLVAALETILDLRVESRTGSIREAEKTAKSALMLAAARSRK